MKLRIGHLSTFYHTAILLMAQESLTKQAGLDAEWRLFGTGPAIVNAFETGKLDLAYIGLPPAIIGIERGVKIKCIAGGHVEGSVICGKKQFGGHPEIERLEDILKQFCGFRIGVPGQGSIHDVILADCLDRFNLRKDVEIINFKWADGITEAMAKGDVSACVGTPALAAAVRRYADGKILYPPSLLMPNNPSYGILVANDFLKENPGILKKFIELHEEATAFIRNRTKDAAKIISDYVGFIDEGLVLDAIRISPKYCAKLTEAYVSSTMKFVKILRELGYIKREMSPDEIFDASLIKNIHPEKDHYGDGVAKD